MNSEFSIKKYKGLIIIVIIVLAIACIVGPLAKKYNDLVRAEEDVNLAYAQVENDLQKRLELIPDLVSTVKSYAKHEEDVYKDIANARAALNSSVESKDIEGINKSEEQLNNALVRLNVIIENYPELKAGEHYTKLMNDLEATVNDISTSRTRYNEEVNKYNKIIRVFPGNIYASIFGFEYKKAFEANKEAHKTNIVDFGD